jgi:hypothetical protein
LVLKMIFTQIFLSSMQNFPFPSPFSQSQLCRFLI